MELEIFIDEKKLDLYAETDVRFSIQANSIAEVKDRQASYTNSFKIPKTPNNISILNGLSISSDSSTLPYEKPNCYVKLDGLDYIKKGWFNIKDSSNDDYSVYIYSGIVNFFKAIENKTLGKDLDLSELNHSKDLATVLASFTNPAYKYLIADYNGLTNYGANGEKINIDYLVPSVNVKYLFDKIHEQFGFEYEGSIFSNESFTNLWMSYPKYVEESALIDVTQNDGILNLQNVNQPTNDPTRWYRQMIVFGYNNNTTFIAPETGVYKLTFNISATNGLDKTYLLSKNQENINFAARNYTFITSTYGTESKIVTLNISLNAGDVISFLLYSQNLNGAYNNQHDYNIKWQLFENSEVSFSNELSDFNISAFIKEILNHFCLTVYTSETSNKIIYKTLQERISKDLAIDWSDKYIRRTSENYIFESYAQSNVFKYKYNDKEGSHNDGNLIIYNPNLKESNTAFASSMYSPEKDLVSFQLNPTVSKASHIFKFYDKTVKESNGQTTIEYKGLDKRFYFLKQETVIADAIIGSASTLLESQISAIPMGTFSKLDWNSLLNENYQIIGSLINKSRIHKIDLDLTLADILLLDLIKPYYFKQEQNYYILDSVEFNNNKATGIFVRLSSVDANINLGGNVSIFWNPQITLSGNLLEADAEATITGSILNYTWQIKNASGQWQNLSQNAISQNIDFSVGQNEIRIAYYTTQNPTILTFSNTLTYVREISNDTTKCYEFEIISQFGLPRTIDYINLLGQNQTITFNFNPANEVKILQAKGILSNGGASVISQVEIACPVVPCEEYEVSKFAGSGDDLWVEYVDCLGNQQSNMQYGVGVGQVLSIGPFCAKQNTVVSNGNINNLGAC